MATPQLSGGPAPPWAAGNNQPCADIERAERRALRLFLHSPSSRMALGPLALTTPHHQRALDALRQIEVRLPQAADGVADGDSERLARAVLSLCPRLDPELAQLLETLCRCGADVRRILAADPGPELMAILDVLEPVAAQS